MAICQRDGLGISPGRGTTAYHRLSVSAPPRPFFKTPGVSLLKMRSASPAREPLLISPISPASRGSRNPGDKAMRDQARERRSACARNRKNSPAGERQNLPGLPTTELQRQAGVQTFRTVARPWLRPGVSSGESFRWLSARNGRTAGTAPGTRRS